MLLRGGLEEQGHQNVVVGGTSMARLQLELIQRAALWTSAVVAATLQVYLRCVLHVQGNCDWLALRMHGQP